MFQQPPAQRGAPKLPRNFAPFPCGLHFNCPAQYHIEGSKFEVGDLVWFEVVMRNYDIQWGEARVVAVLDDNCYKLAGKTWDYDWVVHPLVHKMGGGRPHKSHIRNWTIQEARRVGDDELVRMAMSSEDSVANPALNHVPGEALFRVWDRSSAPMNPINRLKDASETVRSLEDARLEYGDDLGFAGVKQRGFGPEMWAISFTQLEGVRAFDGYQRENTMYDVVDNLVKPRTQGLGVGYALHANESHPLRAQYMVSHAWNESYLDFVNALSSFGSHNLQHGQGFWVCAMAIYQCEDIPELTIQRQLGDDVTRGPFATVLKQAERMLAVLTPVADIYTRMWCVFEMFVAVELSVPVELAAFRGPCGCQGKHKASFSDPVWLHCRNRCDSHKARCGSPDALPNADEIAIRRNIESTQGGYAILDSAVEWAKAIYFIRAIENGNIIPANPAFQAEPLHPLLLGGGSRFDLLALTLSAAALCMDRIHLGADASARAIERKILQLFKENDRDGDGRLLVDEVKLIMANLDPPLSSEETGVLLKECDVSGDGKVRIADFIKSCFKSHSSVA